MKKLLKFSFLLVLFSMVFAIADVDAQNYGKKKKKKKKPAQTEKVEKVEKSQKSEKTDDYFDESGNFASHLWYGGSFNIGFSGSNEYSTFVFGLTPMVGYKIVGELSAGPIAGFQYNYIKGIGNRDFQVHKEAAWSWSLGVFSRYKFLNTLFLHTEFGMENNEYFLVDQWGYFDQDPLTFELRTVRQRFTNFFGGIGYNSGGEQLAFEMYVVYNFLDRLDDPSYNPFNIRFGITYKF